jgi:hypothetical protein
MRRFGESPAMPAGLFLLLQARKDGNEACYHGASSMVLAKKMAADVPAEVASRIAAALQQERVVPRFVDSYVVEHGRYALQVHAALYRDLLALLQREALLAATARALEISIVAPESAKRSKPRLISRKDAAIFRKKYLSALTRLQKWTAGDALDFQNDLQMYEELLMRVGAARRQRKPFEAANHPFVDRCAFLLDSSFLEKARLAASRAIADVDELAEHAFAAALQAAKTPAAH